MRRLLPLLAQFVFLAAVPATAQVPAAPAPAQTHAARPDTGGTNAERILNDRYTRSHDYDLVHQRIELSGFDWDSNAVSGRVVTTLVARRAALDSVVLDAAAGLGIRSVSLPRAAGSASGALRWRQVRDTLIVYPARPAAFGDTLRFQVDYRARTENGKGLTWFKAEPGRAHRPQQIWSQGEDMNNHYWFPTYDFPNDKATWEIVATVPARYMVVANGRLVADRRNPDGTRTLHWSQEKPASTYLASIVVAPLVKVSDRWRGRPVDYYVYAEDSAKARPLFRVTPDMMEVYSKLTGVAYPWSKYAQTTVADFFGGMENVSATTLVDWLPDARAYADRPWYQHILIPHELAHQWFGDLVTIENWANMWLNEGFAEFMPGQYWAEKHGPRAEDEYYLDEYRQFMRIDQRRRMPLASTGSNNIYPKGALVLRMLKQELGPQRFWASLNRYLTQHAYDNAVSDDLRQAVLDATGENLAWFWGQWVYQAGYPEVAVAAQWDSVAKRVTLVVRQTQTDTATADSTGLRFTTPAAFRMPVTVRVGTSATAGASGGASGDVVRRFDVTRREDTLVVDGVATAPTMVIFDDGNRVLKRLTFDQPTAWLATQLRRDPDLWNRAWVTEQLAARPTDTLAAAALADAARSADWFSVRAEAAAALAKFPSARVLPALEAALRDTSAQVRQAAVGALAPVGAAAGGERALALARERWARDTSYEVRAAALGTLARLVADPAERRALLAAGLATPSYQEAIQNAAIVAIVGTGDTSFVDSLVARLGEQRNVAYALGVLGARGAPRALDLLGEHLNDQRGWVRRWAVDAFRDVVPDPVAAERLRAAMGGLRYADTRAAVEKTLAAMAAKPAG